MGIVLIHYSSIVLLTWLCFLCCTNAKAYANSQEGETIARKNYHVIKMSTISISQAPVCSSPHTTHEGSSSDDDVSSLKIFHKYGHCSKSQHHQLNRFSEEKTKSLDVVTLDDDKFYLQEQLRVNYIQSKLSKNINSKQVQTQNSKASSVPVHSGIPLGTASYYVTIGFGTPKRDLSVVFDTGSAFTWIQCRPCVYFCHPQKEPIFDPTKSKTYSNISCNSAACSALRSAISTSPGCSSSTCTYGIQYGDKSSSTGFFASEKLTLTPKDAIPDYLFGCGENNTMLLGDQTAGLLGLGRSRLSFVSQTAEKYGQLFSYCMPTTMGSTGYLTFGNHKLKTKVRRYTPLLTDSRGPPYYFVDLISISVGGTKLSIPTSVFKTSGTIIDSGTVITRLPPSAYSKLKSSFRSQMSNYNRTQGTSLLDTCYNFSGYDTMNVPQVILYFSGGAELDVDFSGIFWGGSSQACLAFVGNEGDGDVAIIGSRQQQTYEVIHDVKRKRLAFIPGSCT